MVLVQLCRRASSHTDNGTGLKRFTAAQDREAPKAQPLSEHELSRRREPWLHRRCMWRAELAEDKAEAGVRFERGRETVEVLPALTVITVAEQHDVGAGIGVPAEIADRALRAAVLAFGDPMRSRERGARLSAAAEVLVAVTRVTAVHVVLTRVAHDTPTRRVDDSCSWSSNARPICARAGPVDAVGSAELGAGGRARTLADVVELFTPPRSARAGTWHTAHVVVVWQPRCDRRIPAVLWLTVVRTAAHSARARVKRTVLRRRHRVDCSQAGGGGYSGGAGAAGEQAIAAAAASSAEIKAAAAKSSQSRSTTASPPLVPVAVCARVLGDIDSARAARRPLARSGPCRSARRHSASLQSVLQRTRI